MKKNLSHLASTLNIPNTWKYYALLMLATLIFFMPLSYSNSKLNDFADFDEHLKWARDMTLGKPVPADVIAHSGWQLLVIFVDRVARISFQDASFVATLLCWFGGVTVLYWWFLPVFVRQKLPLHVGVLLILGISIATPISLLWFLDGRMYLGYIGIASYQNPTILLLKPFALLQFVLVCQLLTGGQSSAGRILMTALVSLLATFVKPSLAICLLPALTIIVAYYLLARKPVHLIAFVFGVAVPIVAMLVWQFLLTYTKNDSAPIQFSPFGVMNLYSRYLLMKLMLSILFPLLVVVIYRRQAAADIRMWLAWLTFIFALFFTYFLAEGGERFFDGNFAWSSEISLVILFAVSTLFYLEQPKEVRLRDWTLRFVWVAHIVSGMIYYVYCIYHQVYF